MSYMWNEFNIKTFPAETIVYRDGVYCADLSTISDGPIDKKYNLPVHIIYVGEIAGKCRLNIELTAPNQKVFFSARIQNKKPAFFDIFIKNTGKNSKINGHVILKNDAELKLDLAAHHDAPQTEICVNTKIVAGPASESALSCSAIIEKACADCVSDLTFTALADASAKIKFTPAQYISAAPKRAEHGAAIYHPHPPQIEYLRRAGITERDAVKILQDAFLDDFPDFE